MSNTFTLDDTSIERIESAIKNFAGNAEQVITDTLHNEGGAILENEITRLMPVSNVKPWKGKKPHAKYSKSLMIDDKQNLGVTVKAKKAYQYLYFPDDGSNTRRHVGNQQFFNSAADNKQKEIIDLCVENLIEDFDAQVK